MSRRICCICLALSVLIATVSIAYADAVPAAPLTEQDYREAVEAVKRLQSAKGGRLKALWKGLHKRK